MSIRKSLIHSLMGVSLLAAAGSVSAQTYVIDPNHTYPSFEAPHLGISLWRGKFTKTSGKVVLDRNAKVGSVDIVIDAASIDFGHQKMNEHARKEDFFHVEKFPTITYKGTLGGFQGDAPTTLDGQITMLGQTRPLKLTIHSFKCIQHPMLKREVCGADASGSLDRADFGMTYAAGGGTVNKLLISIEALREQ